MVCPFVRKGGEETDTKTFGTRLKEARSDKGLTQEDVGSKFGLTKSSIQRYEAGIMAPKLPVAKAIAELLDVNPQWLLGEDVPKHIEPKPRKLSNILEIGKRTFPLFSGIACGEPIEMNGEIETYVSATTELEADFVLRAIGVSMEPGILEGDLVFIRSQPTVENGQVAAVAIGECATLKRVYWYPEIHTLILRADNPAVKEMVFREETNEIRILGRAVALQRDVT